MKINSKSSMFRKKMKRLGKTPPSLIIGLLLGAAATTVIVQAMPGNVLDAIRDYSGYQGRSPNPGSMRLYRGGQSAGASFSVKAPGWSTETGFKHILKNQDSGIISRISLKAYYPTQAAAGAAVYDVDRGVCNFEAGGGGRRLQVSLNGANKFNGVAEAGAEAGTCSAFQDLQFDMQFTPPALFDEGSGLWYNDIVFNLTGAPVSAAGQKNQVRFQIHHQSGAGIMGLAATAVQNQFGLVEGGAEAASERNDPTHYGVAAGLRFGKSCLDNARNPGIVSVYDSDVGKFGVVSVFIMKRDPRASAAWTRLARGEYSDPRGAITWDGADQRWNVASSSGNIASIQISDYTNTLDYLLVYDNPIYGDKFTAQGNVISLGIPGDTINGESSTNCRLNLIPSLAQLPQDTFQGSYSTTVTGSVANTEDNTVWARKTPPWRITRSVFAGNPDRSGNGGGLTGLTNCGWMAARGGVGCDEIAGAGDSLAMPATPTASAGSSGSAPVGSYVCYMTSVRAAQYNETSPVPAWEQQWRHSDMQCAQSVKKPNVQFLGSDLRIGGNADSRVTAYSDGRRYGSWVEYGIFTFGTNNNVASGNGLRNGNDAPFGDWNRLTFSNTAASPPYGGYDPVPFEPAYGYFNDLPDQGAALNVASPSSGVYNYGGDISSVMNVANGTSVIIKKSGTLRISQNINVPNNGVASASALGQVVLFANNIEIDANVTNIDAWLLTPDNGYINTCSTGGALSATMCNQLLTVNGPINTNRLILRRTGGGDPVSAEQIKQPAERFNLRPDAHIWAYAYANKADFAQTDFVQELPPRY